MNALGLVVVATMTMLTLALVYEATYRWERRRR